MEERVEDSTNTVESPAEEQGGALSAEGTSPHREKRLRYVRRIAFDAVFAALALSLFVLETYVPLPIPLPGVKLGLSNIVSLFAMFALGPLDALVILAVRIGLGSLFSGSLTAFLYSLSGGAVCYLVTLLLYFILSERQIWVAGVFGAVLHVSAQVAVAAGLTQTVEVFYYLPVLAAIAIGTGALTGLLAQFTYLRTRPIFAIYRRKRVGKSAVGKDSAR